MNNSTRTNLTAVATAFALATLSQAQTYDVATQFSATSNPNAVWSYGFQPTTLGLGFALYTDHFTSSAGLEIWDISPNTNPQVLFNPTGNPITITDTTYGPTTVSLHPGGAGEFSLIRFTMPFAAQISVDSRFFGQSTAPATTDVHVLRNGVALFNGFVNLNGFSNQTDYSTTFSAEQNDVIDFAVGRGNGNLLSDTTGLRATITVVPEPSVTLLLVSSLGALVLRKKR